MKKTKKALASLAIAGMALSLVPFNAFAADPVTRLGGTTAEQTASLIADQSYTTAATAILASSASYGASDALTAGPLAAFLKAPILLQGPDAALNADTKAELQKLNVKTVYVTSGTAVIKQSVLDELTGMGITVNPLGGVDRFDTSVKIAQKMVDLGAPVKKVAVAYGWKNQDALSIAAIASAANEPIILTDKSGLSDAAQAFLKANPGITASDVIGGTGVIDDAVLAQLPSPTRHFGDTAYDTNNKVIQDFAASLTFDKVFVANGVTGIDALAGAPLAAISKSPIVLTDGVNVPAAATFVHGKMTATGIVTALGGAAVVPETIRSGVATGTVTPTPQGDLTVTSVTAASAGSIKVVFNQAPADTSKVVFTVSRGTSPTTVTTAWNDAKTEATLASAGNFASGDYTVAVKNDTAALASNTVSFTSQRVGKITIDSTVLAVTDSGKEGYVGYHVYDQYGVDITTSYLAGSSYIQWNCGIGTATSNGKGLLTVVPFNENSTVLTQYTTAVITAVTQNQTIPASTNVTLNVSTAQGTVSDITLNKITSADNATPTVGDTEKYYIDYTAKDMAGNATTSLKLLQRGLITNHNWGDSGDDYSGDFPLITSNSQLVDCKVVEDATDDQKAALEVTIKDPLDYNLLQDQPITITASTYTGKTSSLTFTLRRKQAVDTFTLMAPTGTISSGETDKEIPFVAYDQGGKQLTKYSDISGKVTFSPNAIQPDGSKAVGLYLDENADGTASLKYNAPTLDANASTALQENLNATVTDTGKFSTISLNVDLPKKPDSLKLDDSVVVPRMEVNAIEGLDFGYNDGGFQVLDQYGRSIDMTSKYRIGNFNYYVLAKTSDASIVTFDTLKDADGNVVTNGVDANGNPIPVLLNQAYAGHEVKMLAAKAGSATITFTLMKQELNDDGTLKIQVDADGNQVVDADGNPVPVAPVSTTLTKSLSVNVIGDKDITGYVLDTVAKPLYANCVPTAADPDAGLPATPGTAQQQDFDSALQEPVVYGTTTSGSKVFLDTNNIKARTISSSDFSVIADDGNKTKVFANKLSDTKTGSSATVSVTVWNANDSRPHTATTAVTSITDSPVAQSVGYYAYPVDRTDKTNKTGITTDGNTVTVSLAGTQTFFANASDNFTAIGGADATSILNALAGRDLTRFTQSTGVDTNRGYIYLYAQDQYGSKAMNLSNVMVSDCSYLKDADGKVIVDENGNPTTPLATTGADNTLVFNGMPQAGDSITISAVSSNGLVETIKIVFAS